MPESIWLLGFSHYTIAADLILSSVIRSSPKSLWQFSLSLGFYVCNSPCVFVLWLHGLFQAIGNTSDQCVFLSMTEGQEQWQIHPAWRSWISNSSSFLPTQIFYFFFLSHRLRAEWGPVTIQAVRSIPLEWNRSSSDGVGSTGRKWKLRTNQMWN